MTFHLLPPTERGAAPTRPSTRREDPTRNPTRTGSRGVRGRSGSSAVLILILLTIGGCGDSTPEQDFYVEPEVPSNPVAETEAAAAELAGRESFPTTIILGPRGGSGVTGRITTTHRNDGLVVMIEAEALPEPTEFPAHIHRGVCSEGGPVVVALNPVVGFADGTGASTTTLEPGEVSPEEPLFLQLHGGDGTPVACGDLVESDS